MIDKMIVTIFAGFLVVVLAMQLLLCSLPLFRRLEFDAVCHKYTLLMDRAGCMTADLTAGLQQELSDHGFSSRRISATREAEFGENLELFVTISYPSLRIRNDLLPEEVDLSLTYQSSTLCRVIKNYTAVQ